ncbi:MAG: efflux transporter outer membrane subunit [Desulfobacterales bacterium]
MNRIADTSPAGGFLFPLTVLLAAALTGCMTVGPDFSRPDLEAPAVWHSSADAGVVPGEIDPRALAEWWRSLEDPVLGDLIERAGSGNLDLRVAMARIREARARRIQSRSPLFPSVDASASGRKSRGSEDTGSGRESELYSAGFDSGWEIDIFGGVRRSVEAAEADLAASLADYHDVMVTLAAEVAVNYIDIRTFQARMAVAEANIAAQRETLDLVRGLYEAGAGDALAVDQATYNLESSRSRIPDLRTGLESALNRLAVLTAQPPGSLHEALSEMRALPTPLLEVVVGVPADVLRRRPDIRRAEQDVAAQTARVGVAVADLYPRFFLNGSIGLEALSFERLLNIGHYTYGFGPSLSWTLFDAGAIRANIEVQSALQEQALIRYEAAVLEALEEVENAIVAFACEQQKRTALEAAAESSRSAAELAEQEYLSGLVDFSEVLDAQRSLLSFEDQLAQSRGAVLSNLISLYKSLGGGWKPLGSTAGEFQSQSQSDVL